MNNKKILIFNDKEKIMEASRLGAAGYIVKPFKATEILETVKNNPN